MRRAVWSFFNCRRCGALVMISLAAHEPHDHLCGFCPGRGERWSA